MEFCGGNVRKIRRLRDLSQEDLAELVNTSQVTVNGWENGKYTPNCTFLCALSEKLNVPLSYFFSSATSDIFGGYAFLDIRNSDKALLIAARIENMGDIDMLEEKYPFAFEVQTDTMTEAGLPVNSFAIINPSVPVISGDIVLVNINNQETLKWYIQNFDGSIEFRSSNSAYPSFPIPSELAEDAKSCIIGKVVDVVFNQKPKRAF